MLKVAAYARVSTDREDQTNSLKNQRTYFENYIKANGDWELAGIYYDEGVSGTQTKKRSGFNHMIDDCRRGKIDLILTKEVSRFARNTVDALEYTRQLKEYNVGVYFINDNIDTRLNDGEFRLSIMASVAQEESRKISERVKWGQKIAMENGIVFGNNSLYGYAINDGRLFIREDEAAVIKLIYHKYINEGKGTHIIARELYEEGISPPKADKAFWSSTMILRILKNEKYVGDLLQKKYVTRNYLTHKKEPNNGFEDKIYIKNHHEAIIDRRTWERTQEEIERRRVSAERRGKYSNRYWCSGKILCSRCGSRYVIRRQKHGDSIYVAWACRERVQHGNCGRDERGNWIGCNMRMINNRSLLTCMRYAVGKIIADFDKLADEIVSAIGDVSDVSSDIAAGKEQLQAKIAALENKKLHMLDSFFAEKITEEEMLKIKEKYDSELKQLQKRLASLQCAEEILASENDNINELRDIIRNYAVFSEEVYGEILDKIVVYDEYMLIKLKYLDYCFKVSYSTHGVKEKYTTVIESFDVKCLEEEPLFNK